MRTSLAWLALIPLLLASGCASMMSGRHQAVSFKSLPDGADVIVDGEKLGTTPVVAQVRRGKQKVAILRKAGYVDDQFKLETKWNYWMLGNLIFLQLTPFVSTTERKNGTNVEYSPDHYYSVLEPADSPNLPFPAQARRTRIARFIAVCHQTLARDLAAGEGEHLDALWQIAGTPREQRDDLLVKLREALRRSPQLPAFAEAAGRILVP